MKVVSSDAMFDSLISGSVSKEAAASSVSAEVAAPQKKQGRCDCTLVHTVPSVSCIMACCLALSMSSCFASRITSIFIPPPPPPTTTTATTTTTRDG